MEQYTVYAWDDQIIYCAVKYLFCTKGKRRRSELVKVKAKEWKERKMNCRTAFTRCTSLESEILIMLLKKKKIDSLIILNVFNFGISFKINSLLNVNEWEWEYAIYFGLCTNHVIHKWIKKIEIQMEWEEIMNERHLRLTKCNFVKFEIVLHFRNLFNFQHKFNPPAAF